MALSASSLFASRQRVADVVARPPAPAPSVGTLSAPINAWAPAPIVAPAPAPAVMDTRASIGTLSGYVERAPGAIVAPAPAPAAPGTLAGVRLLMFSKPLEETPMGVSLWSLDDFANGQALGDGGTATQVYPIGMETAPSYFEVWRHHPSGDRNLYQTRPLGFNADGSVYWMSGSWADHRKESPMQQFLQAAALAAVGVTAGAALTSAAAVGSTAAVGSGLTATAGEGFTLAAASGSGAGLTAAVGEGLTLASATGTGAGLAAGTGVGIIGAGIGGTLSAAALAWDVAASAAGLPTSAPAALAPAAVDAGIGATSGAVAGGGLSATAGEGLTLAATTGTGAGLAAAPGAGLALAAPTGTGAGFAIGTGAAVAGGSSAIGGTLGQTLAQAAAALKTVPALQQAIAAVTGNKPSGAAPGAAQPRNQAGGLLLLAAAGVGLFLVLRR